MIVTQVSASILLGMYMRNIIIFLTDVDFN